MSSEKFDVTSWLWSVAEDGPRPQDRLEAIEILYAFYQSRRTPGFAATDKEFREKIDALLVVARAIASDDVVDISLRLRASRLLMK